MSTAAEPDYFTSGPYKCGHALCYDDDGHSDGCKFDPVVVAPVQSSEDEQQRSDRRPRD